MKATLAIRGIDPHGAGHYGAPRGERTHKGVDYACYPGTSIHPTTQGTITKLGYPYAHDLSFRYVEVTDVNNNRHRYFYLDPLVEEGQAVSTKTTIGIVQELPYDGITHHCHYEVINSDGDYVNPEDFL